jgi:hypothetical protein
MVTGSSGQDPSCQNARSRWQRVHVLLKDNPMKLRTVVQLNLFLPSWCVGWCTCPIVSNSSSCQWLNLFIRLIGASWRVRSDTKPVETWPPDPQWLGDTWGWFCEAGGEQTNCGSVWLGWDNMLVCQFCESREVKSRAIDNNWKSTCDCLGMTANRSNHWL